MATDFQTGFAGLFSGKTISQLLNRVLWRLGETGYVRYSQAICLDALDDAQRDFAAKTRCLRGWSMIPMRAGIMGYALPKMCLPDGLERAMFYDSATSYDELELRDRNYMDDHYPGWRTASDGTPQILVVGEWFGNAQKIDVYPPPLTAGTTYTDGTDVGVVTGGTDLPATPTNITGTATGGSTTTLSDTEVDFTAMGIVVGMAVVKTNTNAGEEGIGYIKTIATTQLTFSAVLTNSESFTSGDSYEILSGEVGTISSVTDEDVYLFNADVGVFGSITVPANNVLVEFRRYPVSIADVENISYQKPEIPWIWHNSLADRAAGVILSTDTQRRSQMELQLAASLVTAGMSAIQECLTKPTMPMRVPSRVVVRMTR